MKRNSSFPKRIRNSIIILFLGIILIIGGCYDIYYIIQPQNVHENSQFNVKVAVKFRQNEIDWEYGLWGILGILIPNGWTVKDSIKYNIIPQPDQKGVFIFDTGVVEFLESKLTVPDGYHLWGAKTSGQIGWTRNLDSAFCDLSIFTNNKTGNFHLKYIIGNTNLWDATPYEINATSANIPIRIDPSATISKTSWQNEEWEVYPNPSKGQIYIRQGNFVNDVCLKVYDMNGRLQKSDILHEVLNSVDLSPLSKGIYIISLENHGEVKTKRLILQ